MAIRTDWILQIIERLGEALGKHLAGGDSAPAEQALQDLTGLDLSRIDALPAWALRNLLTANSDRREERCKAVADALDAFAATGPEHLAAPRRAKAHALRTAVQS